MKLLLFLITLAFVALESTTLRQLTHDKQYFWIPDEKGGLHLVNVYVQPRFVEPIDTSNVTLQLFTAKNIDTPLEFHPDQLDMLVNSDLFNPNRPTLFNTHGWTGDATSVHLIDVKNALIEKHDFNIINIDWSGPAGTFYTQAVEYVNPIGDMIGKLINELMDRYQISSTEIGLMGHSLGGQLIGRIGLACNGELGYIIALDPAFPSFSTDNLEDKLDSSDARYVQVVHANSGFLGYPDSIGHADFRPNGGVKQTGCGPDILGTCSHFLIKDMIAESYVNIYLSWKCDNYADFVAGKCVENETGFWGGWPIDINASGNYYLTTNGESPFVIS